MWGFVGPTHARFANFLVGPGTFLRDLPRLLEAAPSTSAGHSSAGGWAVLLMLTLVAVQAGTGLFLTDDIFYAGPYNSVVSSSTAGSLANVHHLNFNLLQAVVALHLFAIGWYRWRKRTPLTAAMLHGHKQLPAGQEQERIESSKLWLAL